MSLDVYLTTPGTTHPQTGSGIFIRTEGGNKQISREEWDAIHPGQEPCVVTAEPESEEVYHANITHNLGRMASEAGIYECLWRPDEIGIAQAHQLIERLEKGLSMLKAEPDRFRAFNSENGWGLYENFVPFVENYLTACRENPNAEVSVWR